MGFEVFSCFYGDAASTGIARAEMHALFPIVEAESEPDYWSLRYDEQNSCHVGVTPAVEDAERIVGLWVERPCGDVRLWRALLAVLRMGAIAVIWPGGPPVVANAEAVTQLPADMIDSIGEARIVSSAEEILQLLQES